MLVADLSPDVVAEIVKTPAVELGPCYQLVEDDCGGLAGVGSRVPVATLIGTLFELLRSGGSHHLVRRVWAQYRLTLSEPSPLWAVSWSKTEVIVSVFIIVGVYLG